MARLPNVLTRYFMGMRPRNRGRHSAARRKKGGELGEQRGSALQFQL